MRTRADSLSIPKKARNSFQSLARKSRILQIVEILADREPRRAGEIAYRLQVVTRTIRRDLHYMRDELKLPIEAGRRGFRLTSTEPLLIYGNLSDR